MRTVLMLSVLSLTVVPQSFAADSSRPRQVAQGTSGKSDKAAEKAQGSGSAVAKTSPAAKGKPAAPVTAEREAAVLDFVKQHHSELAELLINLKENNSKEYERAIRDLLRISERLAQSRDRDAERYELELKLWQAQSRIDLLAARLKMSSSDDLRTQLRQGLNEQIDLKQAMLQLERQRAAEKLRKVDEQLNDLSRSRPELVERQLKTLIGSAEKPASKTDKSEKGAEKSKAKSRTQPAKSKEKN